MNDHATQDTPNMFFQQPEDTPRVETPFRRICTPIPAPETADQMAAAAELFPQANCYQPPVLWDRAEGFQVYDAAGNCWIDFSSTAVMTNTGHGLPAIAPGRTSLRQSTARYTSRIASHAARANPPRIRRFKRKKTRSRLGDRPGDLPVRDRLADTRCHPLGQQK